MSRIKDMVRKGFAETRATGKALQAVTSVLRNQNRGNKAKMLSKMSGKSLAKAEVGEKPHRGVGEYQKAMNKGRALNKADGLTEMAKTPN